MEVIRQQHLARLAIHRDKPVIKVLQGVRRCGKSTVLEQFRNTLRSEGVDENHLISLNFEHLEFEELKDYRKLHDYILGRMTDIGQYYIFLDEIQEVEHFEKAINSLFARENTDIYITGSNAFFMSSELATHLSGRTVTIEVYPLSFAEYYSVQSSRPRQEVFSDYLKDGGFPYLTKVESSELEMMDYLQGIFNTVLVKDIIARKKISEVGILKDLAKYLSGNVGGITSVKKISDTITSFGRKTNSTTIESYLSALIDALLVYKAPRFNIKGKELFKSLSKYYLVDLGLRRFLLGSQYSDFGLLIENVVYLELLRRGYTVTVGKYDDLEVDFVATAPDGATEYIQVTASMMDATTSARELKPLLKLREGGLKMVLHNDLVPDSYAGGVAVRNVVDWLLT